MSKVIITHHSSLTDTSVSNSCDRQDEKITNNNFFCSYCNAKDSINATITCDNPDEIIFVNVATQTASCGKDDGRCPGAFSVGCDPTLNFCDRKPNPYGDCCGKGQLWINDDCSEVTVAYC